MNARRGLDGMKVLVVDDNEFDRVLITRMLEDQSVEATSADAGARALTLLREAVQTHPFDIAIVDCRMPEMDGGNLAMVVEGDPHLSSVRIILLSSPDQLNSARAVRPKGIGGYLAKPVQMEDLVDCLHSVTAGNPYQTEKKPTAAPSSTTQSETCSRMSQEPAIDPETFNALRNLEGKANSSFLTQIVQMYLTDAKARINDLGAAIEKSVPERGSEIAHTLKGGSLSLGAKRLARLCAQIEQEINSKDRTGAASTLAAIREEYLRVKQALETELNGTR